MYGSIGYATAHYQGLGLSGVVVQGKLHYTPAITHAGTSGWAMVDLYTGEELFFDYEAQNRPSRGQVYDYESPNQHGGFAYVWRTSGVTLPDRVRIAYARQLPDLSMERISSSRTVDSVDLSSTGTVCVRAYKATWGSGYGNGLRFTGVFPDDDVVLYDDDIDLTYQAYDLRTGEKLWEIDPQIAFSVYGASEKVFNGILYSYGYGGVIYAYNITTGEEIWKYEATTEGFESAYGGRYTIGVGIVSSDGKLYTVTGEHSPTQPLYRGRNLRCLNATTGEEIWKILGFFGGMSPTSSNILMADGILVGLNLFDNQLYAFGRGPSGTTATASPKYSTLGTKVVVEGTITDQTPTGRRNTNDVFEFSFKGTPAISDEDQATWMEYIFMGQPYPEHANGVEVVLTVLDPNSNTYQVGRTTSDLTGAFGLAFEPPVPGTYQITAKFEGSAAYGPSSATTFVYVDEAPSPAQPIEPEAPAEEPAAPEEPTEPEPTEPEAPTEPEEPEEPTEPEPTEPTEVLLFSTTDLAIIAAVVVAAVVGIAAYWTLRKRK
jgi:hypothetical protein